MSATLTEKQERELQAYVRAILAEGDAEQVFARLAEADVPSPYRFRVKVLYAPSSPAQVFHGLAENGEIESLSRHADSFVYVTTVGRKRPEKVEATFFVASFKAPGITGCMQAIISVSKRSQWDALKRLTRGAYPRLVPVLLSQAELIAAAKRLREHAGHTVRVKSFSATEEILSRKETARRSVREWTDEDLEAVLMDVRDRKQVISSIEIGIFRRIKGFSSPVPAVSCKISKEGEVEITGNLRLAFEAVAQEVASVGQGKLEFFSGRGLRDSQYVSQPLSINYANPLFEDVQAVRSLVQLISKYPKSMHAVQHGNPYAQIKVTDMCDFSVFEVWAVPPCRVVLLPGLRASEAAFERLVHFIFNEFREGEIANYEQGRGAVTASQ